MTKKVVFSIVNLRPRKLGTVEEYCICLSKALSEKGWRSILGFAELPPPWLGTMFKDAGAVVEVMNVNQPLLPRFKALREIVGKHSVDIIHSTFLDIFSLDTVFMKMSGVKKVIFSDQVSRVREDRFSIKDLIVRMKNKVTCRWIDMIIADAEFIKKDLIERCSADPKKIHVIFNGVNVRRFCAKYDREKRKKELGIPEDHHVVTTVAKCIPEKGIDIFLRAAKEVLKGEDKVTFVIVGDGPLLEEMRTLASSLGISKAVLFMGLRSDVDEILAISDVFVLCSVWQEAFAFTLLEAMASGIPVVASDIGAIPESVQNGVTGILFPPRDANAAADAINSLIANAALRSQMGFAGRRRVEVRFSMDHWVNKTIEVYEKALAT